MNIRIGENYRIESDHYNYILKKRHVSDPNHRFSGGIAKETWKDAGFYPSLDSLVRALIEQEIKGVDTVNLLDVVRVINEVAAFQVTKIKGVSNDEAC